MLELKSVRSDVVRFVILLIDDRLNLLDFFDFFGSFLQVISKVVNDTTLSVLHILRILFEVDFLNEFAVLAEMHVPETDLE